MKAKTVARPLPYPALASIGWMVSMEPEYRMGLEHRMKEKEGWMREHGPPGAIPASTIAILNRIRASRNR